MKESMKHMGSDSFIRQKSNMSGEPGQELMESQVTLRKKEKKLDGTMDTEKSSKHGSPAKSPHSPIKSPRDPM